MGIISSRTFLQQPEQHSKSKRYFRGKVEPITETSGLVRYELRKEVQYHFPHKIRKPRDSLSLIQVPLKSLQQKDVRSILPIEEN